MLHSILATNNIAFKEALGDTNKYIDILYTVIPERPTQDTVCLNEKLILNAYKLWLQSNRYDYIRNPGFGGLFDNALNDYVTFTKENEPAVESLIRTETAQKWPDINILFLSAKADIPNKTWIINIRCQDKGTRAILEDVIGIQPIADSAINKLVHQY